MHGEAFWHYLETANGQSFETYFNKLSIVLQNRLAKIRFNPLEKDKIEKLCDLSHELLAICHVIICKLS